MRETLLSTPCSSGVAFQRLRSGPREGAELNGLRRLPELPPPDPGNS